MKAKRWSLILVPIVMIAVAVYWLLSSLYVSYGYSVESEFSALPADDMRFEQWLKVQAGVVPYTVHVERTGAKHAVLKVHFIQSRNLLGNPEFPTLDQSCRDLGYGVPVSKFHDSEYQ